MDVIGTYGDAEIALSHEGIVLSISTKKIKLELNLRSGLAINNLAFSAHKMEPCIGTLPHGHFGTISLGADYYSGGVIVELPLDRGRVTDLEKVEPRLRIKANGNIEISADINTQFGIIVKVVEVSINKDQVSLSYDFPNWNKITGTVRLGIMTLINEFSDETTKLACSNGGQNEEVFDLSGEFDHTKSPRPFVSSSRGLGATAGEIKIINNGNVLNFQWDPSESAVMPMLQRTASNGQYLSRLLFSMKELDDSVKFPSDIGKFSLSIAAS